MTGWDEHGHAVKTGLPIDRVLGSGDLQDAENCGYAPVSVLAELGVDTSHGEPLAQFRDGYITLLDGTWLSRGGTLNSVWAVTRRPATPEVQCGDESAHGEHEWLMLGAFRTQCPGFAGRAGVPADSTPKPVEPTGNPRVDALIDALVCPTCRTVYNAAKANCVDAWHYDNQRCRDEYERPGGREHGDRIVKCHLKPGHRGEHEEAETGITWWGKHTPGRGLERLQKEMPGLMPELTDEDFAAADALIAAVSDPNEPGTVRPVFKAERCPRCAETRITHPTYRVCISCAAECGWDPRCEACLAEDKDSTVKRDDHIATCDSGRQLTPSTVASTELGGASVNRELTVDDPDVVEELGLDGTPEGASLRYELVAAYERGRAENAEALAEAQRVADSLGRRLGVRFGEIEQLRAESAQMRDERDEARRDLEKTQVLLEHAEQYARDLQDSGGSDAQA